MTNHFVTKFVDANQAFLALGNDLVNHGSVSFPRGFKCYEFTPAVFSIEDKYDRIIRIKNRKLSYAFMAMETVWILSGDESPWIIDILPAMSKYANEINGQLKLLGAYGPRIRKCYGVDQLQFVIDRLQDDSDSRQATILIANPTVDTINGNKDVACTQQLQFFVREGRLNMHTFMRSNDIMKGTPYDLFFFSFLQHTIASILGIEVGDYVHMANNFHMYEDDREKFLEVYADPKHMILTEFPGLDNIKYKNLEEVYYEASFGKDLLKTEKLPETDGYIKKLMEFVLTKSSKSLKV